MGNFRKAALRGNSRKIYPLSRGSSRNASPQLKRSNQKTSRSSKRNSRNPTSSSKGNTRKAAPASMGHSPLSRGSYLGALDGSKVSRHMGRDTPSLKYSDHHDGWRLRTPLQCQCSCHRSGRRRSLYNARVVAPKVLYLVAPTNILPHIEQCGGNPHVIFICTSKQTRNFVAAGTNMSKCQTLQWACMQES